MPERWTVLESDLDFSSTAKGLHCLPVASLRHCPRRKEEWREQERNDFCVCHNEILLITSKRDRPACDSFSSVTSPAQRAADTLMSPRRLRFVVWSVAGIGTFRGRCWLHGQRPLEDHFDPGAHGQGNFIAAREQHFGYSKPGANESTLADANADMADRSDENACTGGLGDGVDVGIDLVHWFQSAFVVDRPVPARPREVFQRS